MWSTKTKVWQIPGEKDPTWRTAKRNPVTRAARPKEHPVTENKRCLVAEQRLQGGG
jgi:hypothetical protein